MANFILKLLFLSLDRTRDRGSDERNVGDEAEEEEERIRSVRRTIRYERYVFEFSKSSRRIEGSLDN